MKKVKIMLLSLALFAVVGGALAFKAKLGPNLFCTTDAYFDQQLNKYYCSFTPAGGVATTKLCTSYVTNITTDPSGLKIVCTTTTNGADTDLKCQTKLCTSITSTIAD